MKIILMMAFLFIVMTLMVHARNLVINPGFESGSAGWDLRGLSNFAVDSTIAHSGSSSARLAPCVNSSQNNSCGGDRAIWQSYRIDVSKNPRQTIKLSGWVRHSACPGAPNSPCSVNPTYAGNSVLNNWDCCSLLGVCGNNAPGPWCAINDRGGARLGMDFRQGETMFKEFSATDDWTTTNNQWHYLEITTAVPSNWTQPATGKVFSADTVIVWMQGYEYAAPGTVWLDDVSVSIEGPQQPAAPANPIPAPCTPAWTCGAWSICTGTQARNCTDTNRCGVGTGKPAESQSCKAVVENCLTKPDEYKCNWFYTTRKDFTGCSYNQGTSTACRIGYCSYGSYNIQCFSGCDAVTGICR